MQLQRPSIRNFLVLVFGALGTIGCVCNPTSPQVAAPVVGLGPSEPARVAAAAQSRVVRRECQPLGGAWSPASAAMSDPRSGHTATLMDDGRVLAVGGGKNLNCHELPEERGAEIFDSRGRRPGTMFPKLFRPLGHSATKLADGRVLILGGSELWQSTPSLLYTPAENRLTFPHWAPGGRRGHTATLLTDGSLLVVGGIWILPEETPPALRIEPEQQRWSEVTGTVKRHGGHSATRLADGRVLVVGGVGHGGEPAPAEIYDPTGDAWTPTGSAPESLTQRRNHEAVLLGDGSVLIVGGVTLGENGIALATVALFDPTSRGWREVSPMSEARRGHTLTRLPDGRVLVAGGENNGQALATAEIYDAESRSWCHTASMEVPHAGHSAMFLPDGTVMVLGGWDGHTRTLGGEGEVLRSYIRSAEIFTPAVRNP